MRIESQSHLLMDASIALTVSKMSIRDVFVATTAGIVVTLAPARRSMSSRPGRFVNKTAGYVVLACPAGSVFMNGATSVILNPFGSVEARVVNCGGSLFKWDLVGDFQALLMETWAPTLAWTGGPPTVGSARYEFSYVDGTLFYDVDIRLTDGKGATGLIIPLPFIPPDLNLEIPGSGEAVVDGTPVDCLPYVDQVDNTGANRAIKFHALPELTNAKACSIRVTGHALIEGWVAYTPTETFGTATPATASTVALKRAFGNVMGFAYGVTSADSNAASDLTVTTPTIPPDVNMFYAVAASEKAGAAGATYSNPLAMVDASNDTAENRLLKFGKFVAGTDGQAIAVYASGFYEIRGWQAYTPDPLFDVAPASVSKAGRFSCYKGMCFVGINLASADGNGAATCSVDPPVPAYYAANRKLVLAAYQAQHTDTFVNPLAVIAADDVDQEDRLIALDLMTAADDTEALKLYFGGAYPVG